jgi:murein DD-endopeptidase MepM/ murein hydrolase activator NlpD
MMRGEREILTRREFLEIALITLTASCTKYIPLEFTPTLAANLEGAKQWKEKCILYPVIDPTYITKGFSSEHEGVDFGKKFNNYPAKASLSGTAVFSDLVQSGGNVVIIETPIEKELFIRTLYTHLEKSAVVEGQEIHQGQIVGTIGSTGVEWGSHLHFETLISNWPFDEELFYLSIYGETSSEKVKEMESQFGKEETEKLNPLQIISDNCSD